MKIMLLMASLIFSASATAADVPSLELWITEPIGATSGTQCDQSTAPAPKLPTIPPTLTERDVTGWNADRAIWTLSPTQFSIDDETKKLQDHCFVLAIGGKILSTGIVLSSHSERLSGFPTISVYNRNNSLGLQLTSGNHGSHTRLIHVEALNAVLGQHANPKK